MALIEITEISGEFAKIETALLAEKSIFNLANARREASRKYALKLRNKVLDLLGSKCSRCSFDDKRALQIDHVNGGGKKELQGLGRTTYYKRVIAHIEAKGKEYQLLCANCNWIKRAENKEEKEIRTWENRYKFKTIDDLV